MFAFPVSDGFVGPVFYQPNTSLQRGVNHLFALTKFKLKPFNCLCNGFFY